MLAGGLGHVAAGQQSGFSKAGCRKWQIWPNSRLNVSSGVLDLQRLALKPDPALMKLRMFWWSLPSGLFRAKCI